MPLEPKDIPSPLSVGGTYTGAAIGGTLGGPAGAVIGGMIGYIVGHDTQKALEHDGEYGPEFDDL